jgi:hypothetical protein
MSLAIIRKTCNFADPLIDRQVVEIVTAINALTAEKIGAEELGTADEVHAAHMAEFDHEAIAHSNRAALDMVEGVNTGDQDLTPYELVGVAAGLDSAHLVTFVHGDIAHANRIDLNLVSGTNTGDQDLTALNAAATASTTHIGTTGNPHGTTAVEVGAVSNSSPIAVSAAATDPATTMALTNQLRSVLIAKGICV